MEKIKKIVLEDGTELDATGLVYVGLTSKGNVEITSDKNINIEPVKSLKIKPGDGAQIEMLPDHTGDLSEVVVKVHRGINEEGEELAKELPVRLKVVSTETEFSTKGATDVNKYDVKFKTGLKEATEGEHYCQTKLKGRSFDIRCYEHGGIALQPCGKDSDGHENKIKFESSRTNSINETTGEYSKEGGQGIEFGTFNNNFASLFTKSYRFNKDAKVYAVTRGALEEDPESGKTDYPTQADDSKDILNEELQVTWEEIIQNIIWLKNNKSNIQLFGGEIPMS